jgi:hypothetical protein
MKQFNTLREETLEEKLKASDPAGTYVHDFVHSDNPKFAGKSKTKRIQMALAASYAAKGKSRNEEVEIDEEQKTMSRAAKGYEKYGKEGMTKLSQEAQKGASEKKMDAIRNKYNKYDESVDEGMMDTIKTVASKVGKALTGGSDQDQLKNLQKKMGVPQTGKKPTTEEKELDEVNMTAHIKRQATRLKMRAGALKPTNTTMQPRQKPTMEGSIQDVTDTSLSVVGKGINKLNKTLMGKDPSSLVGTQTK